MMIMKKMLITIVAVLILAEAAIGGEVILRRGHAQSPQEARAELKQFKKSYSDLPGSFLYGQAAGAEDG